VVAHVGFCVVCVLCAVFAWVILIIFYFLANQVVEIDLVKEQVSKLCATVNIKPPQKHPDIIRCSSMEME
jgi:hypothetical protein